MNEKEFEVGDRISQPIEGMTKLGSVTELAVLAGRHLEISQCAGGHAIVAGSPCDHCGSFDPVNQCNYIGQIGTPLITG